MSYPDTITGRILAVLDHDEIPERRRAAHLRDACGISLSTARRVLRGIKPRPMTFNKLVKGLGVAFRWLWDGVMDSLAPRTTRVFIERVKGYPPDEAANIQRLLFGCYAEHSRAKNLFALAVSGQLSVLAASRIYARRQ